MRAHFCAFLSQFFCLKLMWDDEWKGGGGGGDKRISNGALHYVVSKGSPKFTNVLLEGTITFPNVFKGKMLISNKKYPLIGLLQIVLLSQENRQ